MAGGPKVADRAPIAQGKPMGIGCPRRARPHADGGSGPSARRVVRADWTKRASGV